MPGGLGEDALEVSAALAARYSKSTVGANRLIHVYRIRAIIATFPNPRGHETSPIRATKR